MRFRLIDKQGNSFVARQPAKIRTKPNAKNSIAQLQNLYRAAEKQLSNTECKLLSAATETEAILSRLEAVTGSLPSNH